jgi:hypothetical protein
MIISLKIRKYRYAFPKLVSLGTAHLYMATQELASLSQLRFLSLVGNSLHGGEPLGHDGTKELVVCLRFMNLTNNALERLPSLAPFPILFALEARSCELSSVPEECVR